MYFGPTCINAFMRPREAHCSRLPVAVNGFVLQSRNHWSYSRATPVQRPISSLSSGLRTTQKDFLPKAKFCRVLFTKFSCISIIFQHLYSSPLCIMKPRRQFSLHLYCQPFLSFVILWNYRVYIILSAAHTGEECCVSYFEPEVWSVTNNLDLYHVCRKK